MKIEEFIKSGVSGITVTEKNATRVEVVYDKDCYFYRGRDHCIMMSVDSVLLNASFWKAAGVKLKWDDCCAFCKRKISDARIVPCGRCASWARHTKYAAWWQQYFHDFIDSRIKGESLSDFLEPFKK